MSSLLRCSTFQTGKLCRIHKLPKTKKKATSKSSSSTWGCSKADSDVASDESMGWFKNTRIMRLRFCHFDSSGVTHNSLLCRSHWMSLPLFSRSSQDLWLSTLCHSSNKEETQYIALFYPLQIQILIKTTAQPVRTRVLSSGTTRLFQQTCYKLWVWSLKDMAV